MLIFVPQGLASLHDQPFRNIIKSWQAMYNLYYYKITILQEYNTLMIRKVGRYQWSRWCPKKHTHNTIMTTHSESSTEKNLPWIFDDNFSSFKYICCRHTCVLYLVDNHQNPITLRSLKIRIYTYVAVTNHTSIAVYVGE